MKTARSYVLIYFLFTYYMAVGASVWPLGPYKDRTWTQIPVDGTFCGDSTPYFFDYSPAITEAGKYRLIIYFPGGGSTQLMGDGSITTNLKSLQAAKNLLESGSTDGGDNIFMDRHENDAFIGDGHWVIFPYCTQDFHSGRLNEAKIYDFTNVTESAIKQEVEALINMGYKNNVHVDTTIKQIESAVPAVNVKSYSYNVALDKYIVTAVEVKIFHRGGLNTEAAVEKLFSIIESNTPDFKQHAKILAAGGSAGGFGVWYNARMFGDLIYGNADANLTLIPMGGTPAEKVWSDAAGDLITVQEEIDNIDNRLSYYDVLRPCEVIGGAHTSSTANCDDGIDLLNHYLQRYPIMDIKVAPLANKQDFVIAGTLRQLYPDDEQLERELMHFCKTTHAYSIYFANIPNTYPYLIWTYLNDSSTFYSFYDNQPIKPEHVPEKAVLLQKIKNPNGNGATNPANYNVLAFMNRLASRTYDENEPVHIEFTPIIVADENDPNTSVSVFSDVFDGNYDTCNCPSRFISTGITNRFPSEKLRIININYNENTSTIYFFLSEEMDMYISQIDLNGKELALAKKKFPTGINTVSFNSENQALGIYIYKFITPSGVITHKSSFIR